MISRSQRVDGVVWPQDSASVHNAFRSWESQLQCLLKADDFRVTPVFATVLKDEGLRRVLVGQQAEAEVTFPAWFSPQDSQQAAKKLRMLVRRQELVTGLRLSCFESAPTLWKVSNQTAARNLPSSAFASTATIPLLPLRGQPAARELTASSVQTVALISYCDDEASLERLRRTLLSLDSNFIQFGYREDATAPYPTGAMKVIVTDDSPEPWASAVRQLLKSLSGTSGSGAEFECFGAAEKHAHFSASLDRVLSSPKMAAFERQGTLQRDEVRQALERFFSAGSQLEALQAMVDSVEPGKQRDAVAQWEYQKPFEELSPLKRATIQRRAPKITSAEVRDATATLKGEIKQFQTLFWLDDPQGRVQLEKLFFDEGFKEVRSLAITYLFAEEIRNR